MRRSIETFKNRQKKEKYVQKSSNCTNQNLVELRWAKIEKYSQKLTIMDKNRSHNCPKLNMQTFIECPKKRKK
jgi:hypothetical protein